MRIGAVNYLNSKPLVCGLEQLAPGVAVSYDLPSRLADSLSAGRLDVALVPSVEFFRTPGHVIVSDACVACQGPVLSVKLYFRVPPAEVRRVALDEGSRTSAALTQILLSELCGVRPAWEALPIGSGLEETDADAVLLIGDRAIEDVHRCRVPGVGCQKSVFRHLTTDSSSADESFLEIWDLGEKWWRWTELPFVFAMWIARAGVDPVEIAAVLGAARDQGVQQLEQIAAREAAAVNVPYDVALGYLTKNLHFTLGDDERVGLRRFYESCVAHDLAPGRFLHNFDECFANGCLAR